MTQISAELLKQKIAEMQNTIATYNGAIQFAEYLLSVLDEDDTGMPIGEFAQAVGGNGATAEIQAVEMENTT